ncbi:hypothetical protein INT43_004416 [Umbelopsis isabellina]|uniref:Uncharacterized protein n=1 Tax=Mortierella isabellina TaxID=91625 RepID=A0A8H7PI52_MORIS|nr:hypothetical protein INT43_004416 [Umbelopsis isabellina]
MAATYIFLTLVLLKAFNAQHSNEPTHIIRFASHRNVTAGDKLIMQQYKKYQTSLHTGAVLASGPDTTSIIAPRNLTTISFGDNFNAVTGTFHSSFIEHLQSHPDIEYVEKNQIYRATRRLPLYHQRMRRALTSQKNPKNWGLARLSNKKKDEVNQYTYDSSAGEGVQVFILDSGINVDHKEFGGRAILDANFVQDESEEDLGGHGTHVAGIIGGSTFGVSKNAELRSVKILDKNGDGSTVNLLQALEHVGKYAKKGKSVINLSLSGPKSKLVNDALSSTTKDYNIPIFVSAGNTADDSCNYSPSDNPDVFAVGATTRDDKVSLFSATGSCVRLYAPGQDIQSAWIGSKENSMILDGTSMANPHVVGIAALLMARKSYKSPNDLYTALTDIATKDELEFYDTSEKNSHNLLAHTG